MSAATVSRTFGAPDLISVPTRERVLKAADRLGYRPRGSAARSVSRRRVANQLSRDFVGFQFFASSETDIIHANAFYAPLLAGAEAEAAELQLHLILHTTSREKLAQGLPKMVKDQAVAGMLLVGIEAAIPEILKVFSKNVDNIVLVDNHDLTGGHDCILSDGFGGAMEATRYLFSQGHTRVGFLLSEYRVSTFHDRLRGYLCAHYDAGIPIDDSLILRIQAGEDLWYRLPDYLNSANRPTGIVAANDIAASAVLQTCRKYDIDVPGDISLVGFDDLEFSSHTFPALTTMRVDKELLGRLALRRLYSRLHPIGGMRAEEPPVEIVTPVHMIVRESVRAI